ncbi:MAG: hypothetical protein RRA92_09270 [Gemmatimonadota bacterium]|nr:hypothetical protein [Gemmatimonadota bacterium]
MRIVPLALVAGAVALAACQDSVVDPAASAAGGAAPEALFKKSADVEAVVEAPLTDYLLEVNRRLAAEGLGVAVDKVEISYAPNAEPGRAHDLFATDRTLRLTSRWVPGDERRLADGDNLTYLNYTPNMTANGSIDAEPEIDASFDTWAALSCNKLPLVKRADQGGNPSAILGGNPFVADIVTLGFLPGALFDLVLGPGASDNVLGVTFTFVFGSFDGGGNFTPSDVDANGRTDTALKEVWYNDAFDWTDTGTGDFIDIQTVALHENGHALELGHFGRVAINLASGKLQVSPRAVMNAFILGTLRAPLGTDDASYCGNWAYWPN